MPAHSAADTSSAPSFLIFICIDLLLKSCTHGRQRSRVRGGGCRLPQQGSKLFRRDLCSSHHLVDLGRILLLNAPFQNLDALGDFAPKFAELNDDVLFGEVWSREDKLPARDRSIVTVTALMASGVLDSSLAFHIGEAKKNGVTKEEMAEILTHAAFYAGWPKAWAAFRMAKEIYQD